MSDYTTLNLGSGGNSIRTQAKTVNASGGVTPKTQFNIIDVGGGLTGSSEVALVLGQAVKSSSLPVTLASDSNPSTIVANYQTVTLSAAALPSTALVNGVALKASSSNTAIIYVGPSGVATSTGYPLSAGETISYSVANLDAIYIIGTNTSDVIYYTGN